MVSEFGAIPFGALLAEPPTLMWEHQGKCLCGRRSYLFGQCSKCLKEEHGEKIAEEQEREAIGEPPRESEEHPAEVELHAGRLEIPDVLPRPVVKKGLRTQHVDFITDSMVRNIVSGTSQWQNGPVITQPWKPGQAYTLPRKHCRFAARESTKTLGTCPPYVPQTPEAPFRICFVVEQNGDVIPLQQCTDVNFEEQHTVKADSWLRVPRSLVGAWEPTPVS